MLAGAVPVIHPNLAGSRRAVSGLQSHDVGFDTLYRCQMNIITVLVVIVLVLLILQVAGRL